ncbi:cupin domain-containing protein [Leptospira levettii]|uniref:cupin domain-containing protein n=1 Tax=Leptospira TaxID=171 RepID=UPI0010840EB3|nr:MULTISPECIES: cupin domain-containing protein [Leptospira]HEU0125355.1 cupin domain-containing protein [Flavobacterium sp.]MBL0953926.1 cupin domain-containing protein [Leptospira sp.]TGM44678.1 cupin domain-containing protein [Leptospira levettii]TGM69129.1 cupin domain-containing protein [Leptospira levettii]TGM75964.1 cupin domain-containing protein [Leptospira levettii]
MKRSKISFEFEKDYGVNAARIKPLFPELNQAPFEMALTKVLPGEVIKKHNHLEYEIFIHLKGSPFRVQIGNEVSIMEKDDVIFAERNLDHEFENIGDTESILYSIWWE